MHHIVRGKQQVPPTDAPLLLERWHSKHLQHRLEDMSSGVGDDQAIVGLEMVAHSATQAGQEVVEPKSEQLRKRLQRSAEHPLTKRENDERADNEARPSAKKKLDRVASARQSVFRAPRRQRSYSERCLRRTCLRNHFQTK